MSTALPAPAASPLQEALLRLLAQHEEDENGLIDAYLALLHDAPEDLGYLVGLIVRDEEHHRELVREMENAVRADIEYRTMEPRVPRGSVRAARQTQVLEITEQLLGLERQDLRKLKRFRRELRRQRDGSLFAVIAEQMEFDTRKHIALLEHIRRWARHPEYGWAGR